VRLLGTVQDFAHGFAVVVDTRDRIVVTEVGAEWASRRAMTNLGEM
jgi:hypothetical protein